MKEQKLKLSRKGYGKGNWISAIVKPSGKFWKRYFNKQVRKGKDHKKNKLV